MLLDQTKHLVVLVVVLIVVVVMLAVHVLLLGFLGKCHDLGHHPVLVLDVEGEVVGRLLDARVHDSLRDAFHDAGSVRLLGAGFAAVILDDIGGIVGVHVAELEDELQDLLNHLGVHPGHDVDLTEDAKHGQELRHGEDKHDPEVGVVVQLAQHLVVVGAEHVALRIRIILVVHEKLETGMDRAC